MVWSGAHMLYKESGQSMKYTQILQQTRDQQGFGDFFTADMAEVSLKFLGQPRSEDRSWTFPGKVHLKH